MGTLVMSDLTPEQRAERALPCSCMTTPGVIGLALCPGHIYRAAVSQAIREAEQAAVAKDRERVLRLVDAWWSPTDPTKTITITEIRDAIATGKETLT